jgi:hypothetical protein
MGVLRKVTLTREQRLTQAGLDGTRIVRHGLAPILAALGEHPGPPPFDHRTLRWHRYTPWNADVLDATLRRHPERVADTISDLVRAHRRRPHAEPTRVLADGHAILSTDIATITLHPSHGGVTHVTVHTRPRPLKRPSRPPKVVGPRLKGGKGQGRGPTSWEELRSWLADAGHTFAQVKSGHIAVYNADGRRVASLSGTPSDVRALITATASLRHATGLRLRQPNPTSQA